MSILADIPLSLIGSIIVSDAEHEDIFHGIPFFTESKPDGTLLELMAVDITKGIHALPFIGPLDVSKERLYAAMLQATCTLVLTDKALSRALGYTGLRKGITAFSQGKVLSVMSQSSLRTLHHALRGHRGQQEVVVFSIKEPWAQVKKGDFPNHPLLRTRPPRLTMQGLELTARRLRFVNGVQDIFRFRKPEHGGPSFTADPSWGRIVEGFLDIYEAAHGTFCPGTSHVFTLTRRQKWEARKMFAAAFLNAYASQTATRH